MKAQCPECSRQFRIPDNKIGDAGLKVRCPACRKISRFFRDDSVESVQAPPSGPPETSETPEAPEPSRTPEAEITEPPKTAEPSEKKEQPALAEKPKGFGKGLPPAKIFMGAAGFLMALVVAWFIVGGGKSQGPREPAPTPSSPAEPQRSAFKAARTFSQALEAERRQTARGREDALELYRSSLNADPRLIEGHARMAYITILEGLESDQRELIDKGCLDAESLSKETKRTRSGKLAMGLCRFGKKDYMGSLVHAQAIINISEAELNTLDEGGRHGERDRQVAEGFVLAGMSYEEKKDRARAVESYKSALARDNRNVTAHLRLGAHHAARRRWKEAVDQVRLALILSPDHPQAKSALETYQAKQDKGAEERVPGQKVELATKAEKDKAYRRYLGKAKVMRQNGNYHAALGQLMKAQKLRPGSTRIWLQMGWVYLEMGSHDAAVEAFQKGRAAGSIEAYYGLGAAYQSRGETANAIAAYETFLKLKPNAGSAMEVQSILNNLK